MANLSHPVPKTEAQINLAMRNDKQGKAFCWHHVEVVINENKERVFFSKYMEEA